MIPIAYRRHEALRLLPLLRSIAEEVEDRQIAILALCRRIKLARASASTPDHELHPLEADLRGERTQLSRALRELSALNCRVTDLHPLRVQIPAGNGQQLAWSPDQPTVLVAEPA